MTDHILLSELAQEWGLDKSNARKYVLKQGFDFVRVRGNDPSHQLVLALTQSDAEMVREQRTREGYNGKEPVINGWGYFYIVQVAPDLDESRIKLGYATDYKRRVAAYRTLSPTAKLFMVWPCRSIWERTAIDSITRIDCISTGGETYTCSDLTALCKRGHDFFSLLPN